MGQLTQTTAELQKQINGIYGSLQLRENVTAFDPTADNTPELFTVWGDGTSSNMTLDSVTNNEIVATVAGTYRVTFGASFSVNGSPTAEVVHFILYKDDGVTPAEFGADLERSITSSTIGSGTASGEIDLAVGDSVQVWVETTDQTKTISVNHANLFVEYIGA
jgi:hypothetical protein